MSFNRASCGQGASRQKKERRRRQGMPAGCLARRRNLRTFMRPLSETSTRPRIAVSYPRFKSRGEMRNKKIFWDPAAAARATETIDNLTLG